MSDPYTTLGVSKTASDQEIRSAYRRLVKQYHPDRNPDDPKAEERFKAVGKAYSIIGDKEKRQRFDRGEIDADGQERAPFGAGGAGGFSGGFSGQGGFEADDLGDIFSSMFGGGGGFRAGGQPRRGGDLQGELRISFTEALLGTKRDVSLGEGRHVSVNIPAGIEDGKTLRLKGKGSPGHPGRDGRPGPAGDVLLKIFVASDPYYTRDGRDVRVTVDVDLRTAVLGGKIHVRTPKGTVAVMVKPHSDSGTTLRLKGRGVAATKQHAAGDLYATLRVVIGTPDEKLEEFLRQQTVDENVAGEG
ncbi:DnaJ domain-containing protein [Saccharibacter sp. 17.LH.SD]|uniref:DnaJ C-terminal domain-containing protein n=1 Tax=Saccharibacter sp. 17.LH.SD TaxID=2689393 RepID=UPI00136EFCE7|nr:DnaJ C-terminal domain-containing protein [Saccharibacter sp. 17.LH.SD]MXV43783.1 DnaJ domain-containing protein [Saccharibacter sp. 17.LH.SD]